MAVSEVRETEVTAGQPSRMSRSAWSWAIYEGGRDPYLILISVYIFVPYFTSVMVGDPVRGQSMVADYAKVAGLLVAVTAPILGSLVDRLGGRKPLLVFVTALMTPLIASLWWARPDGSGLSITATVLIVTAINILFIYSSVVHNALLVQAAGHHAGRASGMALALANVVGVLSLAAVLWAFVLPGKTDWSWIPAAPLFGLDEAVREPDRVVAWVAAGLLAVGTVPLLLFTRDVKTTGRSVWASFVPAVRDLAGMIPALARDRNITVYLVAHVFVADAIGAVAMFLGIYAAGVMHWGVMQMLMFAIWQSIWAGTGGFVGGQVDERVGSKHTLLASLAGSLICTAGIIGMSTNQILYFWSYHPTGLPLWGWLPISLPEFVFLLFSSGCVFWVAMAAAASRTLLVDITPKEHTGVYFGLYALSATATAWLGPMLVAMFTRAYHSQQAGFIPVAVLFVIGFVGVLLVKTRRAA